MELLVDGEKYAEAELAIDMQNIEEQFESMRRHFDTIC